MVLIETTLGFGSNHAWFEVKPRVVFAQYKLAGNFFKTGFFQRRQNPVAGPVIHAYSPDGVGRDIFRFRFALTADGRVKTSRFFKPYNAPLGQQVLVHIFQCINNAPDIRLRKGTELFDVLYQFFGKTQQKYG